MDFLGVNAQLLGGFKYTLLIFFITLVAAIPLGLPIALGSMSRFKPLRWISRAFVWVIRGTPLMLQIMVVFYVPGLVFGTPGSGIGKNGEGFIRLTAFGTLEKTQEAMERLKKLLKK